MGTQCVDRRCVTKVDPFRTVPWPCGRLSGLQKKTGSRRRPPRRLPALADVPMTPVCADSHVDGRALQPSLAIHPCNSHYTAGTRAASGFLTSRRLLPRWSVKTPMQSVCRTSRRGTAIALHNQLAEHSTPPPTLSDDRRATADAAYPAPSAQIFSPIQAVTPVSTHLPARGNRGTDPLERACGLVVEAETPIPSHGSRFTGQ